MLQKIDRIQRYCIVLVLIQAAVLLGLFFFTRRDILIPLLFFIAEAAALFYVFRQFRSVYEEASIGVENTLGETAKEAYLSGGIGMVMYDDNYVITWMSELFEERGINRVGRKVLTWIPEADDLISGKADQVMVRLDKHVYEIRRVEDEAMLFFRDVTDISSFEEKYNEERVVIGLASFDNYEESTQSEDEADVAAINTAVRTPLTEYCAKYGILTKRLNNNRYMLVLNEKIFNELVTDHFSVLNKVKRSAQKADVAITLSMAFARGTSDFSELDEMAFKLMDLAQTRGGDQVAVQKAGDEVKYYGGSSEATEKRSRVRVRVMSHTLRDLIMRSSNIIICGHKTADFDCIGSAICISRMATALHKNACIIAKTGGLEEKVSEAMKTYEKELKEEVSFVTESEALNQLQENSLVIMTDHHNMKQTNGAKVLERAKKIAIIDHHRRSTEMGVKPVFIYIEAGASSSCELLTEMIPYVSSRVDISETAATFMLTGMIIDTNHWRVRTGARTYEAASVLRTMGADPLLANEFLKDTYDEFEIKSMILGCSERYANGVVIAPVKGRVVSRSLMSQAADSLLGIQDVQAAFVIANDADTETAISARSGGRINVQKIMEEMKGGGHLTAAAMQRPKCNIDDLKQELLDVLNQYFKEGIQDESDT